MIRSGRRQFATFVACAAFAASLIDTGATPLHAATAEPAADESAPLVSIARTLERIERLLRLDQSSRLLELRFRRLELLREEMAPLEGELRSYRSMDVWQGPEMNSLEARIADLEEQIEAARLAGRETRPRCSRRTSASSASRSNRTRSG